VGDTPDAPGHCRRSRHSRSRSCGPWPDGHTASLVPGDPVLDVTGADVALTGVYQGRRRMTLTYPVLNRSRRMSGRHRAREGGMLARLCDGDPPFQRAHPRTRRWCWPTAKPRPRSDLSHHDTDATSRRDTMHLGIAHRPRRVGMNIICMGGRNGRAERVLGPGPGVPGRRVRPAPDICAA